MAEIEIRKNGSYVVTNLDKMTNSKGEELEVRERMSLCRCGASKNKPYCDDSHKTCGFVDEKN